MVKKPLLFALILLSSRLLAQHALEFAPSFRNYSTDQGLPHNLVYDIYQDKTGYIWVATNEGISRFNGYAFEQFRDTLYTNVTSVMTGAVTEDERGRLWYVDFQARVFYIENGIIHPYPYNSVIAAQKGKTDFFHGLMLKGAGEEIWLVSHANGGVLHLWGAGKYEHILQDSNNFLVFEKNGKSQLIAHFDPRFNTKKEYAITFHQAESTRFIRLPFDHQKRLEGGYSLNRLKDDRWCLFHAGTLYLLQHGALVWMRPTDKAPLSIYEEPDGALLVGYQQGGLARYRSLDDFRADKKEGDFLSGMTVSKIIRDREGGYWIGTQQQGLFYCQAWNTGSTVQIPALMGQNVAALAWDGQNRLFAGTETVHLFEVNIRDRQWKELMPLDVTFLRRLHFDPKSQTLGLAGQPSMFYQNDRWEKFHISKPVMGQPSLLHSQDLYPTTGHRSWISAAVGCLFRFSLDKPFVVEDVSNDRHQSPMRFYTLIEAPDGRVWASRNDGLFEWRKGSGVFRPELEHPAFLQPFLDIDVLPDSSLVFCPKGHGVVIWKPGSTEVTVIGANEGLPSGRIHALHVESDGVIWACTQKGLYKLSPIGRRRYRLDKFTVQHGLPSNTVNDVLTIGEDIWIATAKGFFCLRDRPSEVPVPAPLFAKILVNNVPYPTASSLNLPHDSADLVIEYLSLYYRSNGDIPYRFRLQKPGDDTLWTFTKQRQVYFSNLPPEAYRFEVQAQDDDGQWSPVSSLAFRIHPPWWATWWAISLFVMGLGLGIYSLYRYRTGQIVHESRLNEEMLRLERSALQAQMNPHFIFNCLNSIQNFILKNESDAAVLYLAKFAKLVRSSLNASVEGGVRLEEEVNMLNHYLNLEQLRFKEAFEYLISVDPFLDQAHTVLPPLIVQPFVENAVLHGMKGLKKDGLILIKFYPENGFLCVEVRDNGLGLRQDESKDAKGSLGGKITRRRLELLNDQSTKDAISIAYSTPESGTGTAVLIRLPLRLVNMSHPGFSE
ncbi:MAG: histidine kinase [Phycisphaerae bacterium]|nr:histidine kinase [Saprospiraceae bacterium]